MVISSRVRKFYEKCTCIIDCTEIFIERPSNQQHNTIKVLIAITPQGTISFISQAWGGRASDKFITEHSGFLDVLSPGDLSSFYKREEATHQA